MVLSLVLIFVAVLAYFGLLGYKNNLVDRKGVVEDGIKKLQEQRDLEMEANLVELKKKIEILKSVLKTRIYPSKIFQTLEELASTRVRFIDLQADLSKMQLILNTEAADYGALAEQITIFKEDSRINKVNVSEINLNKFGQVESRFLLEIDPAFLR